MLTSIKGRTAIVTGATKGLAEASPRAGAPGANVVLVSRNAGDGGKAIAEMTGVGGEAIHVAADVTDYAAMQKSWPGREGLWRPRHPLRQCRHLPQAKIVDLSPEDWDHVLGTNLKGTFPR